MILEQFKEKYVGKAVHCDTEGKSERIIEVGSWFPRVEMG